MAEYNNTGLAASSINIPYTYDMYNKFGNVDTSAIKLPETLALNYKSPLDTSANTTFDVLSVDKPVSSGNKGMFDWLGENKDTISTGLDLVKGIGGLASTFAMMPVYKAQKDLLKQQVAQNRYEMDKNKQFTSQLQNLRAGQ